MRIKKGKEKVRWQEAIIGIALAAILVVSVLALMVGSVSAYSNTGRYNSIRNDDAATVQSVLIGQSLDFFTNWGDENTVTIYRVKDNAVEWTKTADPWNTLKVYFTPPQIELFQTSETVA